ncbi:thioredoxin, partial [Candidatus Saccharibacteria bacterium]|nr:thioredoxin [Calditrichia bacterium]NIV72212.1 thioredoxin [Calditrichia bacterium]NIV99143.1 thioredoxin [Candidatus Saccharibacteria bacterium]
MSYDTDNFQKDVIERSHKIPVLVDFWAEWCGPCKIIGPVLERLAEQQQGQWELVKLNTEEHPDIAMQYGIQSIPNVKLFVDGEVADEFVGALPENMISQWLNKALPSKHRESLKKAEKLLANRKTDKARKLLQEVIDNEPGNHQARVMLAKTYVYDQPEKALYLVQDIEEDSESFDTAESLRRFATLFQVSEQPDKLPDSDLSGQYLEAIQALRSQNFEAALEGFIEVLQSDRGYDDDGARIAIIAIFK